MKPWTRYYPETDSLVIQIADRPGVEVEEIAVNVLLSYDENNEVISIEIPGGATDLLKGFLEGVEGDTRKREKRAS